MLNMLCWTWCFNEVSFISWNISCHMPDSSCLIRSCLISIQYTWALGCVCQTLSQRVLRGAGVCLSISAIWNLPLSTSAFQHQRQPISHGCAQCLEVGRTGVASPIFFFLTFEWCTHEMTRATDPMLLHTSTTRHESPRIVTKRATHSCPSQYAH